LTPFQKTSGNYNAILESSYNANGLITGAETSANEKVIYLTGYSSSAAPFYILYIASPIIADVFSGVISENIKHCSIG
jgi:hypothetical protein